MFDNLFVEPLVWLLKTLTAYFDSLPLPAAVSAYAVALISVAVLVKMVTFPLTAIQMRSMREMQQLQPKLRELQKKHKDDRETLAQKQMELYREHGVNPFGGCLPLLIQMPVLIGLFRAINVLSGRMTGQRLLWIDNLAVAEPLPTSSPPGIPVLIVLMVISQFAYQRLMTPPSASQDPQAEAMNSVMKWSPILFAVLFVNFPAGVVLYYLAFNVVSLVQQWFLNRQAGVQGLSLAVAAPGAEATGEATEEGTSQKTSEEGTSDIRRRRRRTKSR